jgi:hypothetical protein
MTFESPYIVRVGIVGMDTMHTMDIESAYIVRIWYRTCTVLVSLYIVRF